MIEVDNSIESGTLYRKITRVVLNVSFSVFLTAFVRRKIIFLLYNAEA